MTHTQSPLPDTPPPDLDALLDAITEEFHEASARRDHHLGCVRQLTKTMHRAADAMVRAGLRTEEIVRRTGKSRGYVAARRRECEDRRSATTDDRK